jgi:hypothetical protein
MGLLTRMMAALVSDREADFDPFIARFIQQVEAPWAEWPLVA